MRNLAMALVFGLAACGGNKSETTESLPRLDVETAQLQAETYIKNLFPASEVNGPVCMPEAVVDQYTQCSYSLRDGEGWQVGTLLCSNVGCREGEAPTTVAANLAPQATAGHSHSMSNDWLFWYMLYNSGGTRVYYSSWYDSTPPAYRSAYYGVGYRPTVESRTYYTRTYAQPIRSTSTTRFSTITTSRPNVTRSTPSTTRTVTSPVTPTTRTPVTTPAPTRSTPVVPATSRTVSPVTTPKTSTPTRVAPAPSPRPISRPAPTRSSGFRSPSRSGRR